MTEKKNKGGRPPKTTEDLPANWREIVLGMSVEGKSDVQIRAALCGTSINLWQALKKRDQEFGSILEQGKVLCESWWQNQAHDNLKSRSFNCVLWYMNMKNRFGWKDKSEMKHTGDFTFAQMVKVANGDTKAGSGPNSQEVPG